MPLQVLILFFIITSGNLCFCQPLIIDDTIILKKGAYRNIDELKFNSPSLSGEYNIVEVKKATLLPMSELDSILLYKLIGEYENIYGYCDGKYIYIKSHEPFLYTKISDILRYCYFYDFYRADGTSLGGKYGVTLDLSNNKRIQMNRHSIKKIIKSDQNLSLQFKKQEGKNDPYKCDSILRAYMNEYSNRHLFELDRIDSCFKYLQSINPYKLVTDSSVSAYYNRLLQHKKDTFFLEMNLKKTYRSNGNLKSTGLMARHLKSADPSQVYRIGTWLFYDRNGELKKHLDYNITEKKEYRSKLSKRLE